ncbi:MAG: long-chain fatty acid--CoA ligase [Desulfocucumaceae bacterium]
MMNYPLTTRSILERAKMLYSKKEIVSKDYSGIFRYNYGEFYQRVCRLANTLEKLGVQRGDRVGTLAWNTHRHLELYLAIPTMGSVLHTLNLRLFPDQLIYVINHAEDKVILVDQDLLPLLEAIRDKLTTVKHFVIMTDAPELPQTSLSPAYSYEELLAEAPSTYKFPEDLDEWSPAAMCYTTATTGDPKGVVYTHRAIFLHSLACLSTDMMGLAERDTVMAVVPMFHANAWGMPFTATWTGAKQVFPGSRPDPMILCQLIQDEKVTMTAGVPTIWMGILQAAEKVKFDFSSVKAFICGGSAIPLALMKAYDEKLGIPIVHAYGMTETTPLVTLSKTKSYMDEWTTEKQYEVRVKQGVVAPGLELKIVGENGEDLPNDGKTMGELLIRGPWIAGEYYKNPQKSSECMKGGWLYTNDIATIDEEGYIAICDRTKDLIKSGGEWISSVDMENTIMAYPAVAEAAVIAMPHVKWDERPMACVVLKPDHVGKTKEEDILKFLEDKMAKWMLPDKIIFIEEIPKTSVGKFNKKELRHKYL